MQFTRLHSLCTQPTSSRIFVQCIQYTVLFQCYSPTANLDSHHLDIMADLEQNREDLFHTDFVEHYESGHYKRLKAGIRHFLGIYHYFNAHEHDQLAEIRACLVDGFDDLNEQIRQATHETISVGLRLRHEILPRPQRRMLKVQLKTSKRRLRWFLKMYSLSIKQYCVIDGYVVDCRSQLKLCDLYDTVHCQVSIQFAV